jgi:hypothetical protein
LPRPVARAAVSFALRLVPLFLAATAACTSGAPAETIERDVFIDTYVDLRVAALDTDSGTVAAADRDAILEQHGVTEEELVAFADANSAELEFMRDVWTEVEERMDAAEGDDPEDAN